VLTRESWSTRWYVPLLALGGLLIVLLILALVFVQVLIADVPGAVQAHRDSTLSGGRHP
jgi:hypothetical protein